MTPTLCPRCNTTHNPSSDAACIAALRARLADAEKRADANVTILAAAALGASEMIASHDAAVARAEAAEKALADAIHPSEHDAAVFDANAARGELAAMRERAEVAEKARCTHRMVGLMALIEDRNSVDFLKGERDAAVARAEAAEKALADAIHPSEHDAAVFDANAARGELAAMRERVERAEASAAAMVAWMQAVPMKHEADCGTVHEDSDEACSCWVRVWRANRATALSGTAGRALLDELRALRHEHDQSVAPSDGDGNCSRCQFPLTDDVRHDWAACVVEGKRAGVEVLALRAVAEAACNYRDAHAPDCEWECRRCDTEGSRGRLLSALDAVRAKEPTK